MFNRGGERGAWRKREEGKRKIDAKQAKSECETLRDSKNKRIQKPIRTQSCD